MVRKTADRLDWRRVKKRKFYLQRLNDQFYRGSVSFIYIEEVTEPLIVKYFTDQFTIADQGYLWMQHFPDGTNYTLTTVIDPGGNIKQLYIDICKEHGINSEGIPWYDDLYLDLVVLPTGDTIVLDHDDLSNALKKGKIQKEEFQLANDVVKQILDSINDYINTWNCWIETHYSIWLKVKDSLLID